MKAFLEYAFIFDPVDTWQHLYQFEQDLGKFFEERNLEAEILETVGGQSGRRVIVIKPKVVIPTMEEQKDKVTTSKKRLKSLGRNRAKGKFTKEQNETGRSTG